MNKPLRTISWIHKRIRLGVVILAFLLLMAITLPSKAARLFTPNAITNPQAAAILGAQHLLLSGPVYSFTYLPYIMR